MNIAPAGLVDADGHKWRNSYQVHSSYIINLSQMWYVSPRDNRSVRWLQNSHLSV